MFRCSRTQLGVLLGAGALLAVSVAPVFADTAPLCTDGRVPAFEAPDVTLTPEPNTSFSIWSSPVSVLAFCEDLAHPDDRSIRLSGINISAVTIFVSAATAPNDVQMSISKDGSAPFVNTGWGATTITTNGIVSDANGNATFVMRATSSSSGDTFLGNTDGSPRLVGMHFDINYPDPTSGQMVFPDEGYVFAQTPELDSVALFGSGAVSLFGYALVRARARRRG